LLALEGWLEALPDLRMMGSVRNPVAVARSLEARESFHIPYDRGIELWWIYNERLLSILEAHSLPLVSFDLPAEQYQQSVHRALAAVGLPSPEATAFHDRLVERAV
jgi:hypothetical protein